MIKKQNTLKRSFGAAFAGTTPVRLWLLLLSLCIASVLFGVVAVITIEQHEHAAQTVSKDAAPSVFAACQIKIAAAAMDASLASELLYSLDRRERQEMEDDFAKFRTILSKQLVAAAKNITYGETEEEPIENIQIALGDLDISAQKARDLQAINKNAEAIACYQTFLNTLESKLYPNADRLKNANADVLEQTYANEKGISAMSRGLVTVVGLLLIGLILYLQLYVSVRFRRRINLPLLFITIVLALYVQKLTSALSDSARELKVAKEDAYNSIVSLLNVRALAYDANACESKWLLDRENQSKYEKRFFSDMSSIANFDDGSNYESAIASIKRELTSNERLSAPGFHGNLADEFANVRFEEEGETALETLEHLAKYSIIDSKMRALEKAGNHEVALSIGLGYDPHGSNFQFSKIDEALKRTLAINQHHMDLSSRKSADDLIGLALLSFLVSLLTVICGYLGLRNRLAEYQETPFIHRKSTLIV
jgi:Four helix bundle sensory module for signal transduction